MARRRLNGQVNGHAIAVRSGTGLRTLFLRRQARRKMNLELVQALAMLGMTDKKVAETLNITPQKFNELKKQFPLIKAALRKGRVDASADVIKGLYKKATGFSVPEEKMFYSAKHDKVIRRKTRKHFAPDTTAQIFWLKNQFPELWRDKKEVETTGNAGAAVQSVKFVLVQPGKDKAEKVIDADFKILPNADAEKDVTDG